MVKQAIISFWERTPALLFGLILCFGFLFVLSTPWVLIPTLALFFFSKREHFALLTFFFIIPFIYLSQFYDLPAENSTIEGTFSIHSVTQGTRFSNGWVYRGDLYNQGKHTPCTLFSKIRYPANQSYSVKGFLRAGNFPFYVLKTKGAWLPKEKRWTLADLRFTAKKKVKEYIKRHIKQERGAELITGLATGELEDHLMKIQFKELGVSHIIAISGFHFALVAFFFHSILRLFLPYKMESLILIGILFMYYLFIGDSPSVQRAFCVAALFLLGRLLERRSHPLNLLGLALIINLLMNPLSSCTLGFQLSFLATGAILFLYPPIEKLLLLWIPKASLKCVLERPLLKQLTYLLFAFFRDAFALSLAVFIIASPLLILHFQLFSLSGLFYNLFFPLLAGWVLMLLLISVPLPFLHPLNGFFADWLVRIADSPPVTFRTYIIKGMHPIMLAIFFTLVGIYAIYLKGREWVVDEGKDLYS